MSESIGAIYPTQIPGYADNADVQAAFRLYHYGSAAYSTANSNTANLVNPSIAYTLNSLQTQITTLTSPRETAAISATAATGTVHLNVSTASVHIYTANATANYTLNIRGNASTTLNSLMAIGESITVTFELQTVLRHIMPLHTLLMVMPLLLNGWVEQPLPQETLVRQMCI